MSYKGNTLYVRQTLHKKKLKTWKFIADRKFFRISDSAIICDYNVPSAIPISLILKDASELTHSTSDIRTLMATYQNKPWDNIIIYAIVIFRNLKAEIQLGILRATWGNVIRVLLFVLYYVNVNQIETRKPFHRIEDSWGNWTHVLRVNVSTWCVGKHRDCASSFDALRVESSLLSDYENG